MFGWFSKKHDDVSVLLTRIARAAERQAEAVVSSHNVTNESSMIARQANEAALKKFEAEQRKFETEQRLIEEEIERRRRFDAEASST